MISRENLINNPESWISTSRLNLDFFDHLEKGISNLYYLKQKGSDIILFGIYSSKSKCFECCKMKCFDKFNLKIEEISHFISLPPISFCTEAIT